MNPRRLIDTRDLNWWLVFAGIGCDLILMATVTWGAASMLRRGEVMVEVSQITLVSGAFLTALLTGFLTGWLAQGNGATYGVISSAGHVVIVAIVLPLNILALLVAVVAVAGGLNGGLLSERWHRRRRR
jgi:hypothetical protein